MAGTIKIDTAKAVELAKEISIEKRKMAEAFDEAKAAITELCDFWESRVSVKTQAAFNEVANKNAEALYNHLDNYSNFIMRTVAPGYVSTEDTNKQLGSYEYLFK